MTTENHGLRTPKKGDTDWHIPLNENIADLDTLIEIRDIRTSRASYAPKDGAKFLATDTGEVFLGDGAQWNGVPNGHGSTVLRAANYPGAIGGRRIQNALVDAAAVEHGVVVVDGSGPDDVSGYEGATRRRAWLLDSALEVPSRTVLWFRGAHLFLGGDTNSNLVRNAAATSGDDRRDADIHVLGDRATYLNGNAREQRRPLAPDERQTEPGALDHFGVLLYKADRCSVGGFQLGRTGGWGVVAQDFRDCVLHDIHFRQDAGVWNQDGCSFVGPGSRGRITGITGQFGDDFATVYGSVDWLNDPVGPGGDVSNVVISDCLVRPAPRTDIMPSVRLQAGDGTTISDVTAANLSLNGGYFKLINANRNPRHGDLRGIAIANVTSKGARGGLALGGPMEGLTVTNYQMSESEDVFFYANGTAGTGADASVRNVHVANAWVESDAPLFFTGENGGDLADVTFRDVTHTRRDGGGGASILLYNGRRSHDVTFENVTVDGNANGEGLYVAPEHTLSDFRVSNLHLRDVTDGVVVRSNEVEPPVRFTDVAFDGLTGSGFDVAPDGVVVEGVGREAAPADTPTASKWTPGDIVEFVDSDDDSGSGTYLLSPAGSWTKLAGIGH